MLRKLTFTFMDLTTSAAIVNIFLSVPTSIGVAVLGIGVVSVAQLTPFGLFQSKLL